VLCRIYIVEWEIVTLMLRYCWSLTIKDNEGLIGRWIDWFSATGESLHVIFRSTISWVFPSHVVLLHVSPNYLELSAKVASPLSSFPPGSSSSPRRSNTRAMLSKNNLRVLYLISAKWSARKISQHIMGLCLKIYLQLW